MNGCSGSIIAQAAVQMTLRFGLLHKLLGALV
jgi:hypothetical protein